MTHSPGPFILTLELKGRELGRWTVDTAPLRIGRAPDNEIVIDNLSVSRLHAVIEPGQYGPHIRDCGSLNGVVVNGRRVDHATLANGDVVTVGKHVLVCRDAAVHETRLADASLFEPTMVTGRGASAGPVKDPAVLIEVSAEQPRRHTLDRSLVVIGADEAADIVIRGRMIAPYHVEIRLDGGVYFLRHVAGRRRVRIDGRTVREAALTDGCSLSVGDVSFVFRAAVSEVSDAPVA